MLAQKHLRSRCFVGDEYEECTQKCWEGSTAALSRRAVTVVGGWSQLRPKHTRTSLSAGPGEVKTELGGNGLMGQCQDEGKVFITCLKFIQRLVWVPNPQSFIKNQDL